MSRPPVKIGDRTFATKQAAREFFSTLLVELPVGDVPDEYGPVLVGLLRMHPYFPEKMGAGVVGFDVRVNPPYNSRGFWVLRRDGSAASFSYRECLSPSTDRQTVTWALRREVDPQVLAFKVQRLRELRCEITGDPLDLTECEADHHPETFASLVRRWADLRGIALESIAVVRTAEPGSDVLSDRRLAADWCDFHRANASLRILSREKHREVTRGAA